MEEAEREEDREGGWKSTDRQAARQAGRQTH